MADENTSPSIDDTMSRVLADIATRESSDAAPPAAPVASVESGPVTTAPEATESTAGDRPRGPDGKFIPKLADAAPATAAPAQPVTDRAEPTAPAAAPSTAPASGPPVSWSAAAKADWATASPAIKEAALKREQEVSSGFAQKSAELKEAAPLMQALEPVAPRLAMHGITKDQYVKSLVTADEMLRTNPRQAFPQLAQMYGFDLASLVGTPSGQPQTQVSENPDIAALQQEIASLKQGLTGYQQQQQAAQERGVQMEISNFANDGKHPLFETVRFKMGELMTSEPGMTLQAAYDKAAEPIMAHFQAQRAEQEAQQAAERAKAVEEAKRIRATNVVSDGSVGAAPTKPKSWQETLDNRARELNAA